MAVRLRGHHLICLQFFVGKGYSHRFVKNTFRVLKSARMVEVVEGIDDICKACPYCIDKKCGNPRTSDERIRELDELTLSLLSIKIGSRIRLDEVRRKIPKILPVWIKKACKSCNWWKICKNILVKTSLPNQMANIR